MSKQTTYDPRVLDGQALMMMRAQELVVEGYHFYVQGRVEPLKAPGLVRRFRDTYAVHVDKNARYLRKKAKLGNAKLLLRTAADGQIDFLLMVTPGDHPAHKLERLRDARELKGRLTYSGFELVPQTRKGNSRPSWTWQMSADTLAAWLERIHLATAHNNQLDIRQTLYALYMTPGFAGVRKQVGALVSAWRKEWVATRKCAPFPMAFPHDDLTYRRRDGIVQDATGKLWTQRGFPLGRQLPKLFYVRKMSDDGRCLSSVIRQVRARDLTVDESGYVLA